MKVKVFIETNFETELEISTWLSENNISLISINQVSNVINNFGNYSEPVVVVTTTIFYEEKEGW